MRQRFSFLQLIRVYDEMDFPAQKIHLQKNHPPENAEMMTLNDD